MKISGRKIVGIVLALATSLGSAYQLIGSEVKASFEYGDETIGKLRIVGIASITPEKVVCWDTSGTISEALTKKLDRVLQGNKMQTLQFRFGKKNRYVLIKSDRDTADSIKKCDGEEYLQPFFFPTLESDGLRLYHMATDPQRETANVSAFVPSKKPDLIEMPMVAGMSISYNGYKLEFCRTTRGEPLVASRLAAQPFAGRRWNVNFMMEPLSTGSQKTPVQDLLMSLYLLTAVGENGKEINYVDRNGDPVAPEVYLIDPDEPNRYDDSGALIKQRPHKYTKAGITIGTTATGELSVRTNINPARIKRLVNDSRPLTIVHFAPIPLDPKN